MDEVISGEFGTRWTKPWSRDYIRVVNWNVERGLQFSAIQDFLRTAKADLILLQEVDLNARRTQHRDAARELARSLQLNYVFGTEFQELSAGPGGSPVHHGQATLSPWPLSNARIIRFQCQSNFWRPRWYVVLRKNFVRGEIAL
jgi:endonuclease/exonuclease/phosphatase family metal-dependent hydrolase